MKRDPNHLLNPINSTHVDRKHATDRRTGEWAEPNKSMVLGKNSTNWISYISRRVLTDLNLTKKHRTCKRKANHFLEMLVNGIHSKWMCNYQNFARIKNKRSLINDSQGHCAVCRLVQEFPSDLMGTILDHVWARRRNPRLSVAACHVVCLASRGSLP